jgi:hypothetical protein
MNTTEQQKIEVLRHVNTIQLSELPDLMNKLGLTIDDLIRAGLSSSRRSELVQLIKQFQNETERKKHLQQIEYRDPYYTEDTINKLVEDGVLLPGDMSTFIRIQIEDQNRAYNENKLMSLFSEGKLHLADLTRFHLNQMANKNTNYDEKKIAELLNTGVLSVEALMIELNFSFEEVERIINPVKVDATPFQEWAELPPLPLGRTDIYVFGIVGSGKSAMLAGLLSRAEKRGILEKHLENHVGRKYLEELIKRVRLGVLPQSTQADVLNFIPVVLKDPKELRHPLSIIEMSGEKFTQTYRSGKVSDPDSIGAREYLSNSNRKILIFVIDYNHHRSGANLHEFATQDAQLEYALDLLSADGTLDKTDALMLVITKADLIQTSLGLDEAVNRFLHDEYLNFFNRCQDMKKKHKFRLLVYPFSLGLFVLPRTYRFDPKYSDILLNDLITLSYVEKESFFKRIFK